MRANDNAQTLRELHIAGRPLVLPNVWDAASARLVEKAGFPVVATSSLAVAGVLGYSDGESAPVDEMFAAAARIVGAVTVPVTVDAEAGYGLPPAELVGRLIEIGAVGCNLEDTDHRSGQRRKPEEQAEFLAGVRAAAGDALVINARVDVFLGASDQAAMLPDAVRRAQAYFDAGADCVYPILVRSPDVIGSFADAVRPRPVNVTYLPGGPDVETLTRLGVARISLGGGLWKSEQSWLSERLSKLRESAP